jgi:hypothetical protein
MSRPAVLLAVALLVGCGGGEVTADSLKKDAEAVQSAAAEGALLAADAAEGRTAGPFLRVHAEELAAETAKVARKLEQAQARGAVQAKARKAFRLARDVEEALTRLAGEPDDRTTARRLRSRLEGFARAAEELARS